MGCFFSGHRNLPTDCIESIFKTTKEQIIDAVKHHDIKDFYAGGAIGFDMIASIMVLSIKRSRFNNINLHIIMPTPNYGNSQWKTIQQKEYYRIILQGAKSVATVSADYYSGVFFARNQRLTELGCDLGIVYAEPQHRSGGTYNTIKMAEHNSTKIINIYDLI